VFGSSYRILTIWGIPIKIHMSLIILLIVFALPMVLSGGPAALVWLLYVEAAIFTSIALHELGHSFVAIRKGCRVREITLMFIGGAAQMEQIPSRPRDEFEMAVAGPAVSIVLGLLCWFGGATLPLEKMLWPLPFVRKAVPCNLVQLPGLINFALAFFNLIPSFPMDGGRVLRSLLTPRLGRLRATFIAARLGKIIAVLFGIHGFFSRQWMLVVIAFFIYTVADKEYRLVQFQEQAQRPAGTPPPPPPGAAPPDEAGGDQVIVGPPPYRDAPDSRPRVRPAGRRNPFRRVFWE